MHAGAYPRIVAHTLARMYSRMPMHTRAYQRIVANFPVLKLYYKQAQSSQEPKRGISSTKVALQASTIQPGAETRHSQFKVVLQASTIQPGAETRHFQY